ncbi:hypothetical protein Rhein_3238, partial [Rheinheimera sp. A13L]|uniref:hypothetical protein n=1 Tax=Rheinheimera sp. A13L TaxID=506534 RepID=UPI00021256FD
GTNLKSVMNPQTGSFNDAIGRTAVAGLVGGTVSSLTGGKFANGAATSAIQWWFNAEGDPSKRPTFTSSDERMSDVIKGLNKMSRDGKFDSVGDRFTDDIELKYNAMVNAPDPDTGVTGYFEYQPDNPNVILYADQVINESNIGLIGLNIGHELVHRRDFLINPGMMRAQTEINAFRWTEGNAINFLDPGYATHYQSWAANERAFWQGQLK